MTAILVPAQDMPCFNHSEFDEALTPSSDGFLSSTMNTQGMFYSNTGPADLLAGGSAWGTTEEGTQNFPDYSDHGSAHPGDAEDFAPFGYPYGHITPRGQGQDRSEALEEYSGRWPAAPVAPVTGGEPMKRGTSRSSAGSHKHRTIKPSSSKSKSRARLASSSSKIASMEITGNSPAFREGTQPNGQMDVSPMFLDPEASSAHLYYSGLHMGNMDMTPDGLTYPQHDVPCHVDPSQMQLDPDNVLGHSPVSSWEDGFSGVGSRRSCSPLMTDTWSSSPGDSRNCSPIIDGQSPSMARSLAAQPMLSSEDLTTSMMTAIGNEDAAAFSLPPSLGSRRQSNDGESARDHYLYKTASPRPDGLYHCPWEGQSCCNHKPEKLKCNYDKFVDSHLKPYRCKVDSCLEARFSSTACLLRHEREAHAMHGHGDKPFLCTHDGCDRAQLGNGFPRQWNLKDHMRRVHNDNSAEARLPAGSPPAPLPVAPTIKSSKGRKRKTETSETSSGRKASTKSTPAVEKPERTARDLWYGQLGHLKTLVNGLEPESTQAYNDIEEVVSNMRRMSKHTSGGHSKRHQSYGRSNSSTG